MWATRPHRSAVAAKKEGESPSLLWLHPGALAGDVDNGDGISVPSRIASGRAPWREWRSLRTRREAVAFVPSAILFAMGLIPRSVLRLFWRATLRRCHCVPLRTIAYHCVRRPVETTARLPSGESLGACAEDHHCGSGFPRLSPSTL